MGDTPSAKVTIQCTCGAALAVPANRAGAKVACPKCGTHLVIPAAAPVPAVPPPAGWYVSRDRKKVGPYSASQLRQMAAAGELAPEDMVLRDGQKQWVAADTIKGLFPDSPPPPPPPLPPTPSRRKAPAAPRNTEKAGPPWLLIGIGAVVLLAAGVGAGVFLATRGSGTQPTQVTEGPKPAPTPAPVQEKTPDDRGKEKAPDDRGAAPTPPPPPPDEGTPKPPPPPPDTTPGTAKPPVAPVVGQRALDLRFVPADAGAAVVVHPARILQSPLVKAAVPTAAADEMLKELGIRPDQIEQALVLLSPGPLVPPGATPPPPKDSWVELDSKEGRFALRFPAKPKQSERKTLLGTRQVHTAEVEAAGLLFEIAYVDFPADSPIVGALSRVDFGTRALEFKPGFKNKKDLKLGSALGAEVVIDDTRLKTFSVHRVYVVGDRLYHLEATTRKGQAAPPEFERFFSSLRLPGTEAPSPAELLPPELMPAPAAIVRFTEAIDGKPLLEKLLRGARPAKHEGKDYLVGSEKEGILGIPVAAAQPDDRTVLLAPEPLLKKMLTAGDAKSPLLDSLRTADGSDDLTVWIHPAPFRKALALIGKPAGAMLPPPLAGAATLPERLASLKLTANLRGKTLVQLTLDAEDAASAPAVEKLVQAGQDLLQKLAPSLEPMLSAPGMPKGVQKELLAISEQLASGLERTRSDRRVQLTLSRPARKAAGPLVAAFKPYLPQGAMDEVDLGGEVAAAEAGGGGRYLVYHLKAAKKLALFDVQQGKVLKQLPVLEEPMFFAANARQLAVLYPVRKLLTLRDLDAPDTPKNLTLPAPLSTAEIGHVCMGSASAGPLFCYLPGTKSTVALDLAKGTVRPVQWAKWGPHNAYGPLSMRVSADGRSLLGWGGGWAGLALARFDDRRQVGGSTNFAFSLGLFANVNADGQMVYYPDAVASGPDLQAAKAPPNHYLIPAAEPGFYLGLDCGSLPLALPLGGERKYPGVSKVTIFADNRTELLTLTDLPELKEEARVPWEKTVHYFPRGGLLVTPADKGKVVLRRLDLVERLKKTEVDYLFVMTQPATAKPGTTFTHRLDIRSRKDEGRQVKLVTGPEGLQVSADGALTWAVPAEFAEDEATALVSVRDASGQEILHPQRIRITDE